MKKNITCDKTQLRCVLLTLAFCMLVFFVKTDDFLADESTQQEITQDEIDEFMKPFNRLMYLFTTVLSTLGSLYTLWCIGEWGLAWHESQGNVGGQSFKRMFGGIVMIMAPQLLSILT